MVKNSHLTWALLISYHIRSMLPLQGSSSASSEALHFPQRFLMQLSLPISFPSSSVAFLWWFLPPCDQLCFLLQHPSYSLAFSLTSLLNEGLVHNFFLLRLLWGFYNRFFISFIPRIFNTLHDILTLTCVLYFFFLFSLYLVNPSTPKSNPVGTNFTCLFLST